MIQFQRGHHAHPPRYFRMRAAPGMFRRFIQNPRGCIGFVLYMAGCMVDITIQTIRDAIQHSKKKP